MIHNCSTISSSSPDESMSLAGGRVDSLEPERDGRVPLQQPLARPENGASTHNRPSSHSTCMFIDKSLDVCGDKITSVWPCCRDSNHRRLACCSVICGLSCIGATALIYSVKAEERKERDPERARAYSKKARRRAIVSITVCVVLPFLIFALVVFGSYILTFVD